MIKRQFSELDILIVAREVSKFLKKHKVKQINRLSRGYIIHFFKTSLQLVVVPHPASPHTYLTDTDIEASEGHRFSPLLTGYILDSVKVVQGDRIMFLRFSKKRPYPDHNILAVEFTGKDSNSCVINDEGQIVAVSRVTKRLAVGKPYSPPPKPRFSLFDADESTLKKLIPWLMDEFLHRFGEFDGQKWRNFLMQLVESPEPTLYCENNQPVMFSPTPLNAFEHLQSCSFELYSQAVEAFFSENSFREAESRVERTRKRIMDEIRKLSDFEKYRRWGEYIIAHINEIPPNARELEIDGEKVRLDVADTVAEAAEHYFSVYRKQKRGLEKLMQRLKELSSSDGTERSRQKRSGRQNQNPARPYRVFYSPSGFRVLVGKSAAGNELITFGLAADHDLFFHARGVPGAHVILKRDAPSIDVPQEDIEFAARLALKHSRAAKDGKGDVTYTERRFVKKPSGSPAGLVILERENVINVRLD